MEIRSFGENAAPKLVAERTIEGHAVVFGQESRVIFDKATRRCFVEVIQPGAVTEEMLRGWDIKALCEHDKGRMLARSFRGVGSLSLSVDDYGVKYRFEAPNTHDGDYVVEMIKRGDMFGSSFAFLSDETKNVRYTRRSDGMLLRSVMKLDFMSDVSVVSDPAYMGTDVSVRSLECYFTPENTDEAYVKQVLELRNLSINN